MQAVIYILAVIGGLTVIGAVAALLLIIFAGSDNVAEDGGHVAICALTMERCIYDGEVQTCIGCPVEEEAEKIGNR